MSSGFGLGVDFQPGLQESFVKERSSTLIHSIGLICFCRSSDPYAGFENDGKSSRPDYFCTHCGGTGYQYRNSRLVMGMLTSWRQQKNNLEQGIQVPGTMSFSPSFEGDSCDNTAYTKYSMYDKLTSTFAVAIDSQVIIRNAANTGTNASLNTGLLINQDLLNYQPDSIVHCEDQNGRVYKQDGDLTLGPGRTVNWINPPPDGTRVMIKYTGFIEWIINAPPMERIDYNNKDLGQFMQCQKRDVVFLSNSPLATVDALTPWNAKIGC